MAVFAELDPPDQLIELLGFESPSRGPLVILVTRTRGHDVRVFDAESGARLGLFTAQGHLTNNFSGIHVYESGDGPVLVLAPPGETVRQWLLPGGRPLHPPIEAGPDNRAVTSYRQDDDQVLAIADAGGSLRRFNARTGTPQGQPVRFRPAPRAGLWTRLSGKSRHSGSGVLPAAAAIDDTPSGPSVLVADGRYGLWRVEERTASAVPFDPPLSVIRISADPLGRPHAAALRSGNGVGVYDILTGEVLSPPVSVPAVLDDNASAIAVVADGDGLSAFMTVGTRLVRVSGDRVDLLVGPSISDEPTDDDDFLDGLCVLPVGGRTMVFAAGSEHIYRFDVG